MLNDFLHLMRSELMVTLIIFVVLFIRIGKGMPNERLLNLIHVLWVFQMVLGALDFHSGELFAGMFHTNGLVVMEKTILNLGLWLILLLNTDWLKHHPHLPEFFVLIFSSLLGFFLLISSGNLLIFFLALELATIPIAALSNFDLQLRRSSEAAMKMILSSAFASGILLFGISLVYGATGTIQFDALPDNNMGTPLQITAGVLLFTAFAFKLSAVPFHLWTADVYEGSPVVVTSYLSVISKGAVSFILLTFLYKVFPSLDLLWYNLLVVVSLTTVIVGNLFALRQKNIKRFLAFSSIAQVGFILAGMTGLGDEAATAVIYFVLIYIFSNLAAFGVVAAVSAATGKEHMEDYQNFYNQNKFLTWMLALGLISLAGIPPTAGFFGKFFLFTAAASKAKLSFILVLGLNLMVSLYYYMNFVRSLFFGKGEGLAGIHVSSSAKWALWICAAGILITGFIGWVYGHILDWVILN